MVNNSRRLVGIIGCRPKARMRLITALAAVVLTSSVIPAALAAGDAEAGKDIARRWCTGCHVVDRSEEGTDTAPPFPTIARRHPKDDSWLRGWLTSPHPPMPNLNLSRREIDDVIAYLDSLTPR